MIRGNLYPFFWCKWYLVSSFQICVGGPMVTSSSWWRHRQPQNQSRLSRDFSGACFESHSESNKLLQNNDRNIQCSVSGDTKVSHGRNIWFCHVTRWGHMIFRFILFWNVQIGRNSLVFQPIHVGVTNISAICFVKKRWTLIWNPLYFCASEFRSKAIWPTADNRLITPKRERP